jgi:hypothetical protein
VPNTVFSVFGVKKVVVTTSCRKFRNEEFIIFTRNRILLPFPVAAQSKA